MMDSFYYGGLSATSFLLPILLSSLFLLMIPYILTHWRNDKEGIKDDQVGIKVILNYFLFSGVQILLATAAALTAALFSGEIARVVNHGASQLGVSVIIGVILVGTHKALLAKTNNDQHPRTARFYSGLQLLITGIITITALAMLLTILFNGYGKAIGAPLGLLLVYGIAWLIFVSSLLHRNH